MKKNGTIPLYSLSEMTNYGLEIRLLAQAGPKETIFRNAHRDDHYIFIFQKSGESTLVVDFNEVHITGCSVFYILPGQVHYGISAEGAEAWFIALDPSWLDEKFRPVFEESISQPQPISIHASDAEDLQSCIQLVFDAYKRSDVPHFHPNIIRSLIDACMGMFASAYYPYEESAARPVLRTTIISRQFRKMLLRHFRHMKSPSDYAAALHISPAYLNEAVKHSTGLPVSYWIHQQIILEAKRILFYTDSTVKEIAHALGYEDDTYFIRLFSKTAGLSPQRFRRQYRE